jgi:hypothetical protein
VHGTRWREEEGEGGMRERDGIMPGPWMETLKVCWRKQHHHGSRIQAFE